MPVSTEDILTEAQPAADLRVAYGSDPNQFIDVRIPRARGSHAVLLNIHGGYWRAKYDLVHAGNLCEALRAAGLATFNIEYRRVGNPGGGWPGSFEDVRSAYHFILQQHTRFDLDPNRLVVMGHSAGGQLALCLAAHEPLLKRAISLAGVVDLKKAFTLHLSNDAVVEFLGGTPEAVPEHYKEADPMELSIPRAQQWLIHGLSDETVPPSFSRDYVSAKKRAGETADILEIPQASHFDLIDPTAKAFPQVKRVVLASLAA